MAKPKRLGDFTLKGLIGEGRIGKVYLATQDPFGREVALKVIEERPLQDRQVWERFQRETSAMGRLEHPHVIPIYAAGMEERYYYIAMRYLRDGTLEQQMACSSPPAVATRLRWVRQIVWAVSVAHERGIIHRDIKLRNILIDNGSAFLTDFGLAKLHDMSAITEAGQMMGTPLYMSPEQFEGSGTVSAAQDVYALGVALYTVLANRHPFLSDEEAELPLGSVCAMIQQRMRGGEYPAASSVAEGVSPRLDEVIQRCLAVEISKRYADGREVLAAIDGADELMST